MLSLIRQSRLLLLLLLLLLLGFATSAFAINFSAYWLYRQTGAEGQESIGEYQQRYSLGVGPSVTYQPTNAVIATASVGYSNSQRDEGGGMTSSETITPSAQVSLNNDIFSLQLSGSNPIRKSSSGAERSSQSWDSSLSSRWDIPLFPSLRFNYGEQTSSDSDSTNQNASFSLDWDVRLAQLYYQYSDSQSEDAVTKSLSGSSAHFARLETAGKFWNERVAFDFGQQYRTTTNKVSPGALEQLSGNRSGKVDAVTDPNPTDPFYVSPDGAAEQTVNQDQRLHLQFSSNFGRVISVLRIYPDTVPGLLPAWDLYSSDTSSPSPFNWVSRGVNILGTSGRDENDEFYIEIAVPGGVEETEILLVATNANVLPLTVRKFQAFTSVIPNSSSSYLTNFGLRARFTRTLSASVNLNFDRQISEQALQDTTSDQLMVSGNLRWTPVPYLSPSIGFSENRRKQLVETIDADGGTTQGEEEQLSRTYSLTLFTAPLKTMNVVFGATRTERYDGVLQTASIDRLSISSKAQIYPDLSADLSFSEGYSDTWTWDDNDDHLVSTTNATSFSSRLNLNAKLTRTLIADFTTSYSTNDSVTESFDSSVNTGPSSSESGRGVLSLQYRPSDLLALRGSYTTYFLGAERVDEKSIGMTLGLLRTEKTRLTLVASRNQAATTNTNFLLTGSWDISRRLSMLTQSSLSIGELYRYSILTTLTLRL
jgi:hypothetical protein